MTPRTPPHNLLAEQNVLGAVLLQPRSLEQVTGALVESDFYRRDHQLIYRAILELDGKNMPFDAVTLQDWFQTSGVNGLLPEPNYIVRLANDTTSAYNVGAYVKLVKRQSTLRRVIEACGSALEAAWAEGAHEADEIVDQAVAALLGVQTVTGNADWTARTMMQAAYRDISAAFERGGKLAGIPTGLTKLDEHFGGLRPSDLTVIGGRPAMGKTAFLLGAMAEAAKAGYRVGLVSAEQPANQIGLRLGAYESGVSVQSLRRGKLEDHEWSRLTDAMARVVEWPVYGYDRASPTVTDVFRTARRWKRQYGLDAIYVDYLQRLEAPGREDWQRVKAVAKGLKNIARELDIAVIALAQVKREVEDRADKRPRMRDLCDSSEIEKEADQVCTLYRDEYYNPNTQDVGVAEILIDKNRHGDTGYIKVAWDGPSNRFSDL